MRNRNLGLLAAVCVAVLAASACAGTKWVTTWTDQAAVARAVPLKKILVIGMSPDPANRRIFEDTLVDSLKDFKVDGTPSYRVLPEGKVSEDELRAKVKEDGYDGVIITRLISMDEKVDYVPPSSSVAYGGYGWGPYWSGYGGWYGTVYSPGYLVSTTVVRLETRLWSAAGDGKPVWTGVSESIDPQKVSTLSSQLSYLVVKDLSRQKLI